MIPMIFACYYFKQGDLSEHLTTVSRPLRGLHCVDPCIGALRPGALQTRLCQYGRLDQGFYAVVLLYRGRLRCFGSDIIIISMLCTVVLTRVLV